MSRISKIALWLLGLMFLFMALTAVTSVIGWTPGIAFGFVWIACLIGLVFVGLVALGHWLLQGNSAKTRSGTT